jgi:DNA-binding NtrC family response regulator
MACILIVDDHRGAAKWVSKAMTDAGHRTFAIGDAASALKRIKKRPPELVLVGSLSERIDSLELLMDIKREHPKVPVLAYAIKSFDAMDGLREAITGLLGETRSHESEKQNRK